MTVARPPVPAGIAEGGVIAIARLLTPETVRGVADGLVRGGVRAFELPLNDPEERALAALEAASRHAEGSGLVVGAGTVLSIEAAERAIGAGARFLVAPHTDPELVAWAAGRGVPMFPGAFTPGEVLAGWRSGAAAVKVFPASVAGTSFIRELRGPFPDIPLVPSGGVTIDNAGSFIAAGAFAVGIGSWLIGDGGTAEIAERAAALLRAVGEARRE